LGSAGSCAWTNRPNILLLHGDDLLPENFAQVPARSGRIYAAGLFGGVICKKYRDNSRDTATYFKKIAYAGRLGRSLALNEVLDMHPQEYPTLLARATFWGVMDVTAFVTTMI